MEIFITIVHVLVGIFLILVVLLQSGRSGGLGATIGGGSSTGVFGARGANTFLSRVTAGCAIAFFLTSMTLAVMSSKTGSVVKSLAPATPAAPVAPPVDANMEAPKDGTPAPGAEATPS